MVDEESGGTATGQPADLGWHPAGAVPKDPGWYPLGTNPNEQGYWDGQAWTGRRHWSVNHWVEEGTASPAAGAGRRLSANPYVPPPSSRPRTSPATMSVGVLFLMVSGVALMFGSVGSWIHVSGSVGNVSFHGSLNGIDQGITQLISVNGYVTFIAGVVLLVLGGLALTNDDLVLAVITVVVAGVTLVFAVYDMFRIVQKISNVSTPAGSSISVGSGLICVLSAAALAMIITLLRLLSR